MHFLSFSQPNYKQADVNYDIFRQEKRVSRGAMISFNNSKARLFITYLKGRSELLLYVKPRGTYGSRMIYRRSPGDTAMNLRIQSLLDQAGVLSSQLEIWIMLYPPEIQTTTLYVPSTLNQFGLREQIREQLLVNLPYSVNYDWKNYLTRVVDNGDGTNMVTVTLLGKSVLPRVKALLYKRFSKVNFIGDGLQFLAMEENQFPHIHGKAYQVILPYDEIFYLVGFRSGIHTSSCALTHANSAFFGKYKLDHQQAYLDCRQNGSPIEWPQIQPIVSPSDWQNEWLTPAAFPAWLIAKQSLRCDVCMSFVNPFQSERDQSSERQVSRNLQIGYLD